MGKNKFVYFGETIFDLTGDTVTADKVLKNITFHGKDGEAGTGTCTFDSDTSSATVAVAEILDGKTAYARGAKLTGTMPNIGKQTGNISTKTGTVSISQGYHDGSGSIGIDPTAIAQLTPQNLRKNIRVLDVTGDMEEDSETPEPKRTVTPSKTLQSITPAEGYTCLREVEVLAIPYTESPNAAGGTTVTIG